MKTLFLDSNLFLQCRDLNQLAWEEISGGQDLLLLIPRATQKEIDRLKHDGNTRRAKRARKTTSFIRQVMQDKHKCLCIQEKNPQVQISFTPAVKDIFADAPDTLDRSQPDDQIIAEALTYKTAHPDQSIAILSGDTNILLTADRCSLPYVTIPEDWLLPPEPDSRDKRITELERQLRDLEKKYPQIGISAIDAEGNRLESLAMSIVRYETLSDDQVDRLLSEAKSRFPMVTRFDPPKPDPVFSTIDMGAAVRDLMQQYEAPSPEEIREYQEEIYPQWEDSILEFLRSLPSCLERPSRLVDLSISVTNAGTVPAENIVVDFELFDGLCFRPPHNKKNRRRDTALPEFPKHPRAPQGKFIHERTAYTSTADVLGQIELIERPHIPIYPIRNPEPPPPRDRHTFYWRPDRPLKEKGFWSFECIEFRHQCDPEIFAMPVYVPAAVDVEKSALKCRVTAKNLPQPAELIIPITVTYAPGDTFDQARSLLKETDFE